MSALIFELIPKIMGEIGAIGKNGTNTYDNYKFRSIDDVYNKVQPVLAKNGVFFKPTVLESIETAMTSKSGAAQMRVKMKVEYTFFAKDGSSFTTIVEGEAVDRGDKATNKAMTAALKYMLIQVFCIAIEGQDDADNESPEIGTPNQERSQKKAAAQITPDHKARVSDLLKKCASYRVSSKDICQAYSLNDAFEISEDQIKDLVLKMIELKKDPKSKDTIFAKAS